MSAPTFRGCSEFFAARGQDAPPSGEHAPARGVNIEWQDYDINLERDILVAPGREAKLVGV